MKQIFLLSVAFLWCGVDAQARPYDDIMKGAQEAFAAEDYAAAAALLDEAQAQRPYSLYLTRNRILARALTARTSEALALVKEVADRGLTLELPRHEAMDRLKADPAFAPIAARMTENAKPIGEPHIVAEFPENGLLPEAIAKWDDGILIGSVRTGAIFAAKDGKLREMARLDGGVFDIELDAPDRIYAAVNNQLAYEKAGEREAEAAIVKVDLKTGEVTSKAAAPDSRSIIGDLEIRPHRIYSTDSVTPRVFMQDPDFIVRPQVTDDRFVNLQGAALDAKNQRLFVADYLAGLFVIDLPSGEVGEIANPSNAHLGGVDGLYLYKGDLIGVQNGTTPQRIVRIDLDKSGRVAKTLTVLQQALPEWNEPTHGFVDGDEFVYVATSNWPAYGDDGSVREGAILAPLRIMSAPLD